MPYRIDVQHPPEYALDRLVLLGALDVEPIAGGLAALLPDAVAAESVAGALGVDRVAVSSAVGRDDGSVWILSPRQVRAGRLLLLPADQPARAGGIRLVDSGAFGTGLHATTALCLEMLDDLLEATQADSVLDVGTGSGVLAFAALRLGVPRAVGLDIEPDALRVAGANAELNGLVPRLQLVLGGPEAVQGAWPLVLANVLAAPLMEMAPALVQRVRHGGLLVLSGIPVSLTPEVQQVYRRLGMQHVRAESRSGWSALVLRPSW